MDTSFPAPVQERAESDLLNSISTQSEAGISAGMFSSLCGLTGILFSFANTFYPTQMKSLCMTDRLDYGVSKHKKRYDMPIFS